METTTRFRNLAGELIEAGRFIANQGWVPATSGNFSARLDDAHCVITVSGRHKGRLALADLMVVDSAGVAVGSDKRPSAETILHTRLYQRYPQVGAVLHTHSMNATLLSRKLGGELILEGYELLKAFPGIETHETRLLVPIFPNNQDIPRLADQVDAWLDKAPQTPGYLISGHGLYTWGRSVDDALRHIEAFEFLFQCELHGYKENA